MSDLFHLAHESDLEYHGDLRLDLPDPEPEASSVYAGVLELPWDHAIRLGGCGREIVLLCQGGHSRNDVVRLMCKRYPATPQDEMEKACDRFLAEVEALGALTRAPRSGRTMSVAARAALPLPHITTGVTPPGKGYATLASAPTLPDAQIKKPASRTQDVGRALARGSFPSHVQAAHEEPPLANGRESASPEQLNQQIADEHRARCEELTYEVEELKDALRAASQDAHTVSEVSLNTCLLLCAAARERMPPPSHSSLTPFLLSGPPQEPRHAGAARRGLPRPSQVLRLTRGWPEDRRNAGTPKVWPAPISLLLHYGTHNAHVLSHTSHLQPPPDIAALPPPSPSLSSESGRWMPRRQPRSSVPTAACTSSEMARAA